MSKVHEMMRECDNLATRHWQLEASGRGQSYKKVEKSREK
jgi:hypothetical protein